MNIFAEKMDKIKLNKAISEISKIKSKNGIYTLVSNPEDYHVVNQEVIRFFTKKLNYSGIYIALNSSHCDLVRKFKSAKINVNSLLFIDNVEEGKGCGAKNAVFLGGSKSLTELSIAISEAAKNKAIKFVFFDSVTTLLIYNTLDITEKFVHYFTNKMRNLDINLVIIVAIKEQKTNKLLPILSQFCDKCIVLE